MNANSGNMGSGHWARVALLLEKTALEGAEARDNREGLPLWMGFMTGTPGQVDFLPKFNPIVTIKIPINVLNRTIRRAVFLLLLAAVPAAGLFAQGQDPARSAELLKLAREMRTASQALSLIHI